MALSAADQIGVAGLVGVALVEVPQVLSGWLPSPTTMFQGGVAPERMEWFRRGEIRGSLQALLAAGAITGIVWAKTGPVALWIFIGAVVMLVWMLWEYEQAISASAEQIGEKDVQY